MNVTFEEYVAKPMTAAQIAEMRKWLRAEIAAFFAGVVIALANAAIVWSWSGLFSLGFLVALSSTLLFGVGCFYVAAMLIRRLGHDTSFIVDGRGLFMGAAGSAMRYIPEEADALLGRFKSPDARRLIAAIAAQGRPLVRAELYLATIMEERFKEALYGGEVPVEVEG